MAPTPKGVTEYVRSMVCFCMSVSMAPNIRDLRNAEEWNQLWLTQQREKVEFNAETASGDS